MNLKDQLTTLANDFTINPLLKRTYEKEIVQNYILEFVYNSEYKSLIFTGGTCLRKVYGLNRLSEDLDFDYTDAFDINIFATKLTEYLKTTQKIDSINYKISENGKTVFIKILKNQFFTTPAKFEEVLFVRCDFSKEETGIFDTEINSIKSGNYEFLVKSYNLSTLFANKIAAFLQRSFFKGSNQSVSFKGRDVYDLYWLLNLSAKTQFSLRPNINRLKAVTKILDENEITNLVTQKIQKIDKKIMYDDLLPLVESSDFLNSIVEESDKAILNKIGFVLGSSDRTTCSTGKLVNSLTPRINTEFVDSTP